MRTPLYAMLPLLSAVAPACDGVAVEAASEAFGTSEGGNTFDDTEGGVLADTDTDTDTDAGADILDEDPQLSDHPGVALAPAQQSYHFFGRASSLAEGHYWAVANPFRHVTGSDPDGDNKLDFSVVRRSQGSWTTNRSGHDGNRNDEKLAWGVPVFSPASGVITSCYREYPDNPAPGSSNKLSGNFHASLNPNSLPIHAGGNQVWIQTDDGDMIALTHMQQESIPTGVCPITTDWEDLDLSQPRIAGYTADFYVDGPNRPRVEQGQYVGLVGNSGNSTGPHLHLQYNEQDYVASEDVMTPGAQATIRLRNVYAQSYNNAFSTSAWYPMRYEANDLDQDMLTADEDGPTVIHPAPFLRRASAEAGYIRDAQPVFLDDELAVTAVRVNGDALKLISWNARWNGVTRLDDIAVEKAFEVKIEKVSGDKVLVAYRTGGGSLRLALYGVTQGGSFSQLATYTGGSASKIDLVKAGSQYVTAMRQANGDLKLIAFSVVRRLNGPWSITRRGDASAGPVSAVAITATENFNGVAVAVRTGNNTLKVIPYRVEDSGNTLARGADADTGTYTSTDLDITSIAGGLAVASRNGDGNLEVTTFRSLSWGNLVGVTDVYEAGAATRVHITSTPDAGNKVITSVRDDANNLRISSWEMTASGANIERGGTETAGEVSTVAAAPTQRVTGGGGLRDMLLSAVKDSDGDLKLIYWDVNLND